MSSFRPVDPKQSFPEMEERINAAWKESRVFERQLEQREDAEVWSFYEGPPTANGRPGSHHVLSRVFKDIYPRYRAMRGYRVPRKAGWDCHGLPVELEVEKQLGISSKQEIEDYGIEKFNQLCRESVFTYVEEWNRLTDRIGFWIDLDDPYVTMDSEYIESVWWSLKELYESDRLYEGHRVSPYCPRCGTALSSHEVAQGYRDVIDPSVYVRFPLTGRDASLLIWTTTPWTLPGNYAVAVDPEVTCAEVDFEGETLILAGNLIEKVLGEGVVAERTFKGEELLGQGYEAPFPGMAENSGVFKVISGDFVTTDDGIRPGTTYEKVSGLSPVFRPDGTVTAGNACPLNDGAAAVVVMSDTKAKALGLTPLARIVSSAATGLNPEIMGLGPVEAVRKALGRAGMSVDDIDLFEINEAFAAQVLPSARQLGIPMEKLNTRGGSIALGHPFGMTGARIMTTLIHNLQESDKTFGVETMCVGGGQGMAMVVERLS